MGRIRALAAAAAAGTAVLGLAAAGGGTASAAFPGSSVMAGYLIPAGTSNSTMTVHSEVTVPTVICASNTDTENEDAAVDLNYGTGSFQTEAYLAAAGMAFRCNNGVASVFSFATDWGDATEMAVNPGDVLDLRVTFDQKTYWITATVDDLTSGQSTKDNRTLTGVNTPTDAVVGIVGLGNSVADFGSLRWTHTFVDGQLIGTLSPQGYDAVTAAHPMRNEIRTTPLNSAGGEFQNVWVHEN